MDFDYVKTVYDECNTTLLDSTFVVNATIHIATNDIRVGQLEIAREDLEAQFSKEFKSAPLGLPAFQRLKMVPIDKSPSSTPKIEYGLAGQFAPYDKWMACFYIDAVTKDSRTFFDFSDYVLISGIKYRVKAQYKDVFGLKPVLHVFLVKESNE